MRHQKDKEPLLPEWVSKWIKILGPIGILLGIWWLNDRFIHLKGTYWIPTLIILVIAVLIFIFGRYYRRWYVNKEGRCIAGGRERRFRCRHYRLGARFGIRGCGYQREDGMCSRKVGWERKRTVPSREKPKGGGNR